MYAYGDNSLAVSAQGKRQRVFAGEEKCHARGRPQDEDEAPDHLARGVDGAVILGQRAASHGTFRPDYLPEGKIAFARAGDIWTMNPDSTNRHLLRTPPRATIPNLPGLWMVPG